MCSILKHQCVKRPTVNGSHGVYFPRSFGFIEISCALTMINEQILTQRKGKKKKCEGVHIRSPESHSTQPAVKSRLKCITLQRIKENAISHTIKKRQSSIRAQAIKTCTLTDLFHETAKQT